MAQKPGRGKGSILLEIHEEITSMLMDDKSMWDYSVSCVIGQPCHRIDYVFKLMQKHNLIPDFAALEEKKNDAISEDFRKLGNTHFTSTPPRYVDAIVEYNKAMCYAVSKEKISIALCNRSAAFFHMEMYPECLESIQLARDFGVPENLVEKLGRREEICHEKLPLVKPNEVIVPQIEMPVNEKIPFLAKCLALRENKTFGKHIIAEDDIPAGTIIALEEPYCRVIMKPHNYLRCASCGLEDAHRLFPCEFCTQTMFCSNGCKEKAMEDFHAIECPIIGAILELFTFEYRLPFRMLVRAILAFPDTTTMSKKLKKMTKEKKTMFDFDWSKKLAPHEMYTCTHSLCTNDGKQQDHFLLMQYIVSGLMVHLLKRSTPTFCRHYLSTPEAEMLLRNTIYRQLLISFSNTTFTDNISTSGDYKADGDTYGSVLCVFSTLVNHSCASNTRIHPMGNKIGMITIKNVAAGEQIYNNYGFHFTNTPKLQRQNVIMQCFTFTCNCLACTRNYPLYIDLPIPPNVPPYALSTTQSGPLPTNMDNFKRAIEFVRKYGQWFPIKQLIDAEGQIIFLFKVIYNGYPLRLRETFRQNSLFGREQPMLLLQHNLIKNTQEEINGIYVATEEF